MRNKGFTLIELLVSMGIIAVLTGMAAFNFNQSRIRARDVHRKSDVSQLQKALEVFKIDTNAYPASSLQTSLIDGGYIKKTFNDPKGPAEWADYIYTYSAGDNTYTLSTCLENTADTTKSLDAEGNSYPCGVDSSGVLYILTQP